MLIVVRDSHGLAAARQVFYTTLAEFFLRQLGHGHGRRPATILEAGSGRGQLTFPLLAKLRRGTHLVAVDSSKGAYEGSLEHFHSELKGQRSSFSLRSIKSDVRKMGGVGDASVHAVLSNELLCDLPDEVQLSRAFREFHRVLRPGGVMVHGEWTSCPANWSQKMAIDADSPTGTNTPSKFWNPDELFAVMDQVGFRQFSTPYFETTMRLRYPAAIEELRNWGVRRSFLRQNDSFLRRYGVELPFEHIVRCRKPVRGERASDC